MRTKVLREEFDRMFPRAEKLSKENIRRYLANYLLNKGYSLEEARKLVCEQVP